MNPEYQRTRFLARPPVGGLPDRFGVVTACNPNGVVADEVWNAAATKKLSQQLQDAGRVFFPVTGCSPDLAHREPGFGVICQTAEEVVELGRAWHQEAVFWIENGIVHLLPCGTGERAVLGAWTKLAQTQPATNSIGILAYGSLINDPGVEIEALIVERIPTQTPFPVEYARLSTSRGGGPTVVPHTSGNSVRAEILVVGPGVSLADAKNLLWRRETRKEGTGKRYPAGSSPSSVLVVDAPGFQGVGHVLYTDFPPSGKVPRPDAQSLAKAAVASVASAPVGKDGISYLIQLSESGVETALTAQYRAEVLRLTGQSNLAEALNHLRNQRRKES